MRILSTAISLNVADPAASSAFLRKHVGFAVEMEQDGFVSLKHPDGGPNVVFLRTGLPTFKPSQRAGDAGEGTLIVFVVDDVDEAYVRVARGRGEGRHRTRDRTLGRAVLPVRGSERAHRAVRAVGCLTRAGPLCGLQLDLITLRLPSFPEATSPC